MENSKLVYRKTKIVATIGPASWDEDLLSHCLQAGMNVARLNFSHGNVEQHRETVRRLRKVSESTKAPLAILQDLQGPKIRLADFKVEKNLVQGDSVELWGPEGDKDLNVVVEFSALVESLQVGQSVFIDDGKVELKVMEKNDHRALCEVLHGGVITSRKGVNLPGAKLKIPCLTEKDLSDLEAAADCQFEYIALSFVRSAKDIVSLREKMAELNIVAKIVAKIEKSEAVEDIEAIIDEADAIMVARGDLAVEVGQVHLPGIQKKIIRYCNIKGRPVITATQMLDSMEESSRPTRAEITDVANAVFDGSDALMLSGETAFGKYPVRSIQTMHDIVSEAEKQNDIYYKFNNRRKKGIFTVPESIAMSAVLCAKQIQAQTLVCVSTTGKTSQLISKFRPKARIVAVTSSTLALNRLEISWGIQTLKIDRYKSTEEAITMVEEVLLAHQIVSNGELVVMTLGVPVMVGQKTNALRVFTVGRSRRPTIKNEDLPLRYRK